MRIRWAQQPGLDGETVRERSICWKITFSCNHHIIFFFFFIRPRAAIHDDFALRGPRKARGLFARR